MSNLTNVFTDIANSIRSKTNTSETYKPTEMANAIKYQCDHLVLSAEGFIENDVFGANVTLCGMFDLITPDLPTEIGLLYNNDGTIPPITDMGLMLDYSVADCMRSAIDVMDFINSADIIGTSEESIIVKKILQFDEFETRYFKKSTLLYNDLTTATWVRGYAKFNNYYIYSEPLYLPYCVLTTFLTPTKNSSGTKPAVAAIVNRIVNSGYTVLQAGLLYSRNNTISDTATIAEANNVLILENSDTPATSNVVRKEATQGLNANFTNYGLTVVDAQKSETEGYGVWVRGYAIIDYNGTTKTVYNDAQYAKGLPV